MVMAQTEVEAKRSLHGPAAKATEEVLNHHLQAFGTGDLKGILEDYTDESVIITPDGVLRSQEEMARFFEALFTEFAKPGASFSMDQQVIEHETAYIAWRAETADNVYELGTDTFWIHDGKILVQTYASKTTPKS
jgi:ketosteroid isomerase-like protein